MSQSSAATMVISEHAFHTVGVGMISLCYYVGGLVSRWISEWVDWLVPLLMMNWLVAR